MLCKLGIPSGAQSGTAGTIVVELGIPSGAQSGTAGTIVVELGFGRNGCTGGFMYHILESTSTNLTKQRVG